MTLASAWRAACACFGILMLSGAVASADTIGYSTDTVGTTVTHENGVTYAPAVTIAQANGQNDAVASSGCQGGVELCKALFTLTFDQCYARPPLS